MSGSNKHFISPSSSDTDDAANRPSKRNRLGFQSPGEFSYVDIMMDLRFKMKHACNQSFQTIMQRPSLHDGPAATEILVSHVSSFQAHNRHVVDYLYPSLDQTGEVVAFGSDDGDQLGITTDPEEIKEDEYPPTLIPKCNLSSSNIKMIECGGASSFALDYDGTLYSWGSNDEGQLGRGDLKEDESHKIGEVPIRNVIQIAAGNTHTVFLNVDGQVYTTGQYYTQDYGKWRDGNSLQDFQRGRGEERDFMPHKLPRQLCNFDQKVIRIAAGNNFSAALLEDGVTLVTWGLGFDGQLGRSRSMGAPLIDNVKEEGTGKLYRTYDCEKPMLGRFETKYKKDGKPFEEFVTEDAKVFHNFLVPKKVDWDETLNNCVRRIVDFACGDSHLLVVARDENTFETRVYSAGRNHTGQLGMGDQMFRHVLTPIKALDNKRICKVAGGSNHSFALNMLGDNLYAWGSSKDGALGLFDANHEHVRRPRVFSLPELVGFPRSLQGARIVDIIAGDNTTFAITNQHNVYAWGFNVNGQAGISCDTLEVIGRPLKLDPMETVQLTNAGATKCLVLRAAAGGQHSLLLLKRYK